MVSPGVCSPLGEQACVSKPWGVSPISASPSGSVAANPPCVRRANAVPPMGGQTLEPDFEAGGVGGDFGVEGGMGDERGGADPELQLSDGGGPGDRHDDPRAGAIFELDGTS